MTELSPETQALLDLVEANMPSQNTPEFTRIKDMFLTLQVCTSLSDEEAIERVNLVPASTNYRWYLTEDPDLIPVPCDEKPTTHRHLVFEC